MANDAEIGPQTFDIQKGRRESRRRRAAGRFSQWIKRRMAQQHRRKGYRFMGMDVLFLTTLGRKTRQPRETPVAWFPDGPDAWLIVASAAGSAQHPDWYRNLAAHPDELWIELPNRKLRVRAELLRGSDRETRWRRIVEAQPRYGNYQTKTDRELPVIRLTPAPDGTSAEHGS